MKYFAVCPFCGKRLCKAEEGSKVEMQCPSCIKDKHTPKSQIVENIMF